MTWWLHRRRGWLACSAAQVQELPAPWWLAYGLPAAIIVLAALASYAMRPRPRA